MLTALAPATNTAAPESSGPPKPGVRIAQIMEVLGRLLAEHQRLVLRLGDLAGRTDDAAARDRAALRDHMAAHHDSLNRLLAELDTLLPPDRPAAAP